MEAFPTWFVPQPEGTERPTEFPSPFDEAEPHPWARRAAQVVQASLLSGVIAPGAPTSLLQGPAGGKMFGVLVVADATGRVGFLKAFSGLVGKAWDLEGYVPPCFDRAMRDSVEVPGEAAVTLQTARVDSLRAAPELLARRAAFVSLGKQQAIEKAKLRRQHLERRGERRRERARLETDSSPAVRAPALHALDQESRADGGELRRAEARWAAEREAQRQLLAPLERRLAAAERVRRLVSQVVMRQLHDSYRLRNQRGQVVSIRTLFAPLVPPAGAGDCAAPKLLSYALAHALTPLALAEFWWGAPPLGGGRTEGAWFSACKDKCGPILPFLLEGLAVAAPRRFRPRDVYEVPLPVVFEDRRVVVVNKPPGLLSVPGKDTTVTDSVQARLRKRFPQATGPLLAHRLDLDTSGLLIVALDVAAYRALQAQFMAGTVRKRYVAWLDGLVEGERGTIDFPIRVDFEHRPRQIFDLEFGKPAVTDWVVIERAGRRTRVALFPLTGRTHQLRVHVSHARGLGIPIVGDRLYGQPDERLLLHAEGLSFVHPGTGERLDVEAKAPF